MLKINIAELCKLRNIQQPLPTLAKAGISRTVAYDYLKGERKLIQLQHIEILCKLFHCSPTDLFCWEPGSPADDTPDNPMQAMRSKELPDITAMVKKMTVQELKDLVNKQ